MFFFKLRRKSFWSRSCAPTPRCLRSRLKSQISWPHKRPQPPLSWFKATRYCRCFFRDKASRGITDLYDDWWWLEKMGKMVSPKIAQVWTKTANGMRDWRWFDLGILHILRVLLGDFRHGRVCPVVPHADWGPNGHHLGFAAGEPGGFLSTQQPYTWWVWGMGLLWPPRGLLMQLPGLVSASQRTGVMKWPIQVSLYQSKIKQILVVVSSIVYFQPYMGNDQ